MNVHWRCGFCFFVLAVLALSPQSSAQAAPSARETAGLTAEQNGQLQEAFDDYVAALQALPDPPPLDADRRLRERIIKLALKLDPPPAIPDEAQRRMTSGEAASKSAQKRKELIDAASEFQHALRLAPWLASGYFNLGELQEKLRWYGAAADNFDLYLLAAPTAKDVESVQKRITDLRTSHFEVRGLQTHALGAWEMKPGDLTVNNGSIQFRYVGEDKDAFSCQVGDLSSLERRRGPVGFHVLRIKLQTGEKFDVVAIPDEGIAVIEKAIRDMASKQGTVLK